MMDKPISHSPGTEYYSATGTDLEALREQLLQQSDGRELYYQQVEAEDETITLYGFPRTEVMDLIYELAFPIVKLVDDRATLKVKSNRAVTDFFVIVHSRRGGAFIGKHGQTLDAVENLVAHSVSRRFPRWVCVSIDVDNYRRKRQAYLEGVAKKLVREIERDHRERPLKGLLPKERKFVHQYFTDHPYLTTESRGAGKERTLYVLPRKDIQEI